MPAQRPASTVRLPHVIALGQAQMDLDASLLRWAAAAPGRLVIRTYGWRRPTLTLGRVEPWPDGWDTAALARDGIDVARRPTGGDGVLHDQEVTFSIAASVPGPWAASPRAFADRVADGVANAYRSLDLAAERIRAEERGRAMPAGATPCFARSSPGEVRVGAFKLAGIASKFTRGGALSHASLPLTSRHRDVANYRHDAVASTALLEGHARSAGELLGKAPEADLLQSRLVTALAAEFGVTLDDVEFAALGLEDPSRPGAEHALASRIEVRVASRLLLRDDSGRLFLFLHRDPAGSTFWATPGGGVETGETLEETARREAREELELEDATISRRWSGRTQFRFGNKEVVQDETFFLVQGGHTVRNARTEEMHRAEGILEARWWTADEIEAATEPVYPIDLAVRLRELNEAV